MKKLEQHIDKIVADTYIDKLYFVKYKGKILFQKKGVRGHKNRADAINRFIEFICADYLHKFNYKPIIHNGDLDRMFEDFGIDQSIKNQLTINKHTGMRPDFYMFKDVSDLLRDLFIKDLIEIIEI